MSDCPDCEHDTYWHWHRRADNPTEYTAGLCLCGCDHYQPTSWTA